MAYEKQTWKTGDVITAEKLNHIEEGIALAKVPSADDDVLFYDYDGTLVKSYSKDDFLALTAFPENPSHEGLTAQGWNWSFEGAKSYVTKYGKLIVGQMYITDDGKTRLYIHKYNASNLSVSFTIPTGTVKVDWGDGSAEDTCDSTNAPSHTYAETGDYVISITAVSDEYTFTIESDDLYKVETGNGVSTITNTAFAECIALQTITLHSGISAIQYQAFSDCYCLASPVIPSGVRTIDGAFADCYRMATISLPDTLETCKRDIAESCYALSNITIPESVISDKRENGISVQSCFNLKEITIPTSVTYFYSSTSYGAFHGCFSLNEIHLRTNNPPTIINVSNNKNMRIIVPYSEDHSILNAYKTATGWSNYASQIFEEVV